MSAEAAKKVSERNYGIDLLRLRSMFYIVVLHVLGRGGGCRMRREINMR